MGLRGYRNAVIVFLPTLASMTCVAIVAIKSSMPGGEISMILGAIAAGGVGTVLGRGANKYAETLSPKREK